MRNTSSFNHQMENDVKKSGDIHCSEKLESYIKQENESIKDVEITKVHV